MLFETLLQISTSNVVESARVPAVMSGKNPGLIIDLKAKRVASALREDFEKALLGVIPPDPLPHHSRDRFLVQTWPRNGRCHRASVRSVKPAIRSPTQTVGDRMGVLEPETG